VSYGPLSATTKSGEVVRKPFELTVELGSDPRRQTGPFVSCLMVTRHRFRQAQIAVRCFQRQTWRNRELVIIDTDESDALARWVESLENPSIRFIHLPGCMDSLGDMRNLSVREARGTHVCQWDDDDLSHPARLEAQMAAMKAANARVGMLLRELMWVPSANGLSIARERAHENTLLCEKAVIPAYPGIAKLEDTPVVRALTASFNTVYVDQPELYLYVAHGTNTWDRRHMGVIWESSSRRFVGKAYVNALSELSRCYPIDACERIFAELSLAHEQPAQAMGQN